METALREREEAAEAQRETASQHAEILEKVCGDREVVSIFSFFCFFPAPFVNLNCFLSYEESG